MAVEIKEGRKIASSHFMLEKSDDDLSSKQVCEMGDKVEDMECDPNSQGGSSNDTYAVNSFSDDAGIPVFERSGDAPSDSDGSSEEVEEKLVSNPHAEVSAKPIKSGNMNDFCQTKVGSSTEKLMEVVEMNDSQRPIKCKPPSYERHTALEMEEKPRQPVEEKTTEEMDLSSRDVSPSLRSNEADPCSYY